MCKRAGGILAGSVMVWMGNTDRLVIEQLVYIKKKRASRRKERQTEDEHTCPKREKGRLQPLQSMKAVRG